MTSRVLSLAALILFTEFLQHAPESAQQLASGASPEMDRLAKALVGEWETIETMAPSDSWPQGASRKGSVKSRLASGGYTLVYEVHSDGSAGKLDGFLTIWWDQGAGLYRVMACFNNPTSPCGMRGSAHWEGDAFVNDYDLMEGGRKTSGRDTFTFTPSSHKLVAGMEYEGIMKTMITINANRVTSPVQTAAAPEILVAENGGKLSAKEFNLLMSRLAHAWNSNDAKRAADCFAENAIYSSPPNPHVRRGRAALFEFFGGRRGRPRPMHMEWHHLLFDEANQIGTGEYTFSYDIQTHGMVIVKVSNGRIANWREYEQESPASWEEFISPNVFGNEWRGRRDSNSKPLP